MRQYFLKNITYLLELYFITYSVSTCVVAYFNACVKSALSPSPPVTLTDLKEFKEQ